MSFVDPSQDPNQNPDENQSQVDALVNPKQNPNPQTQPDTTPPSTSGAGGSGVVTGGGVGGSAASGSASAAPNTPSKSGSWTNLNSYLDANRDQGSAIGSQIANTVGGQGSAANDEVQNLNTGFNQAVQSNTVNEDKNAVNQALNSASNITAGQALSQSDIDAFNRQANASYSGPTDMTKDAGYSKAAQDAQAAYNNAQQAKSESGRDVMLQDQFKNASSNGYTQGENNLDQMLLEGSGGAQVISQAADPWAGLNNTLSSNVNAGNAAAQAAQSQTNQTSADALSAFNASRGTANTSVANALAAAKAGYSTNYDQLVKDLNGYSAGGNLNLSAQEAQMLGLTSGQKLYNLYQSSPTLGTQYLQQQAFDPNKEITANQQAELAALDQLGLGAHQTATNIYTHPELAGTQSPGNSVDATGFNQALTNAGKTFNDYAANTNAIGNGYVDLGQNSLHPGGWSGQTQGTVQNYLNGGSPTMSAISGGPNVGGVNDYGQDAYTAVRAGAQQDYWNQIMKDLQTSGYNNQVNIT